MFLPSSINLLWKPDDVTIIMNNFTLNQEQVEWLKQLIKSLNSMYSDIANAINNNRTDFDSWLDQAVKTTSSPTFVGLLLSGLTATRLVVTDGSKNLSSIASDITSAELETLSDDSMADSLHRHSELSASDGSPNPALRVDTNGNVGIGTTSPGGGLTIRNTNDALTFPLTIENDNANRVFRFSQDADGDPFIFLTTDGGTDRVKIDSEGDSYFNGGNVGIGTTSPGHLLELVSDDGAKPSTNTWTIVSDERLKENIELANLERCYEIVKNLPLRRFTWPGEVYTEDQARDRSKLGWISQDVKDVFPKAVSEKKFRGVPVEDGIEEYDEQEYETRTVEEQKIEIIDGAATLKVIPKEISVPLFDKYPVFDESGNPVLNRDGTQQIHKVPKMTTKTRPKFRPTMEIEDCLDMNADQIYAAMYGTIQYLINKVEYLESQINGN